MIQCPHCDHRVFETGISISARVRLTGLPDGDYREEEIDSYAREWHALTCCRCGYTCDEEDARTCFEVATCEAGVPDDIYEWHEAQYAGIGAPTDTHPGVESAWAIACAWNLARWKQARAAEHKEH